ncbi:hypothetical protein EVAR_39259_1 [Eumeta japonica]|uniref:Uncharacterized protein n=1 Tax=Eumeta variegata TaxID=151549 RepID=A0A4C1Y3F1_EUMVA|nr:hypothetical protein EVAR_39259_1 [Eumeta japonica]
MTAVSHHVNKRLFSRKKVTMPSITTADEIDYEVIHGAPVAYVLFFLVCICLKINAAGCEIPRPDVASPVPAYPHQVILHVAPPQFISQLCAAD